MESLSILGVIYRLAKEIVNAARRARQCKSRCADLARRVEVIAEIVRQYEAAPNDDSATRTTVLSRLKDALEEALEAVESCRSVTKLILLAAGRSIGSRIDDADRKINNCLLELGVANDVRLHSGLVGGGDQQQQTTTTTTTSRRLTTARDGAIVNNSGILLNINSKRSKVRLKQETSMHMNISAGRSVNFYSGDSSSSTRNWTKEDSVAAIHNNSRRASVPAGGAGHVASLSEATTCRSAENQVLSGIPAFKANRHSMTPPQGLQECQYPYGGAGDHGVVPYNYICHSMEEDPNSCSIM